MGLSVGLVSPKKSKWRTAASFATLHEQLTLLAGEQSLLICEQDFFTLKEIPYRHVFVRPFLVSFKLYQVRRYRGMSRHRAAGLAAMELISELRRGFSREAYLWLLRNRNITAAHQSLWAKAHGDWIAVFEDDLEITSEDFVAECRLIIEKVESLMDEPPNMAVFLSSSFTPEVHGFSRTQLKAVNAGKTDLLWAPSVGIADTTAATIYSRSFLADLRSFFDRKSEMELNTLPIDWLVDDFFRTQSPQDMWSVLCAPGLCRQSSLG